MKVGVVGAGPAGALLAWRLALDGADVTVYDASHPREKPCGGGVTGKALDLLPPAPEGDPLPVRLVDRCRLDSGAGPWVDVPLKRPVGVAARRDLDAWLLRRATGAGAQHVAQRVVGAQDDGTLRLAGGRSASHDLIVGADGAGSLVRRTFLKPTPPARLVMAAGWFAPGTTEMVVRFTPGLRGYLWLFPRPNHVGVGIGAPLGEVPTRALLERLEHDVTRAYPALAPDADAGRYAHTIPTPSENPADILEIAGERWALVGDAAALADPITGEGIYYALASALLLADTLRGERSPASYPRRVLDGFGRELLRAAHLRERFFAPGFATRVVRYGAWSPAMREVLCDLVVGEQHYGDLKRRLVRLVPRFLWEAAWHRLLAA
jgi:flavin-dependent dehydrogenase